jgi:iron(II)-dependent oxidoreductase
VWPPPWEKARWLSRSCSPVSLSSVSRSEPALALEHARQRTEALLEPLSDEQLTRQLSPLQSPLVWDLAHIGHFEELWLLRRAGGRNAESLAYDELYDASAHARGARGRLPILPPDAARAYVGEIREAVLGLLPELSLDDGDPLLEHWFVVGMVVQHELQHSETMAQTLALAGLPGPVPQGPPEVRESGDAILPGGSFTLGAVDPWAYDNERPAHPVDLPAFRIDRALVTNAEYTVFVDAGGYRDRDAWSDEGWAWRETEDAGAPLYWELDGGRPLRRRFDVVEALPPREPVQHVSFHEAEAYARWAGKRLPTEAEWEKAVKTVAGQLEHVRGAVWQWTASSFDGYPGFRAFPYAEYSELFFGEEYRVLRGGSWFTDPLVARPTFRNWDLPQRRQIFSGLRCARDG